MIGRLLLLQLILIFINAFFAATEIALLSLNDNVLRKKAKEGDKKAAKMLSFIEEPTVFLSTIQIGITLAGFLASAFAAENFSDRLVLFLRDTCGITMVSENVLNTVSVILITLILSYFTLVLGELVPKRVATIKAEKLARAVFGIMLFLSKLLKPIVFLLSVSTNGALRLFGINPHEETESVSEEEIRMMIDIGNENGTIEGNEKEMIENIFEFNNITAADVMIHRKDMSTVWDGSSNEEILDVINESGYSRFPVCGEDVDSVLGILRTREYLLNLRLDKPKPLSELLTPAYFVPETVKADALFRNMQKQKVHMAIVVDEYGGTMGLVTMEDLLEKIVGNIYDETDTQTVQNIEKIAEDTYRIAGITPIDEICDILEVDLHSDDEDYGTLGGFIFSHLDEIPDDGTKLELEANGLHIKVDKISDRRIETATVTVLPPADAEVTESE